jgi:putative hydrolase of the HAD superfamily
LLTGTKSLVFDLDGTLYVNRNIARQIHQSAVLYIASLKNLDEAAAEALVETTQNKVSGQCGCRPTLTAACMELGADIAEFHRRLSEAVKPELFLNPNEQLARVLTDLGSKYRLYIYTNNNRPVSLRILKLLGIDGLFRRLFTIEDSWRPKPDQEALRKVFSAIDGTPEESIFIGDRYDVDLRLPAAAGAGVLLVENEAELLNALHTLNA